MKTFSTIFTLVLLLTVAPTLTAQVNWTKYEGNPVLVPGSPGDFDDYSLFPFDILFDGSTYHIWYGGHDGTRERIGYASSPDGITWTKYAGNPVLSVGTAVSWDDGGVGSPCVLFDGNTYHMWYVGSHGQKYCIGYATSLDGITWTKYAGNPVMDTGPVGSWTEMGVGGPFILFDDNTYHMWYDGWSVSDTIRIGYATSPDGITWTPYEGNPVLTPDLGLWDSRRVEGPDVFFDGNVYHMWYTGGTTTSWWHWRIGYTTSLDGITWTKDENNPVLKPDSGQWDSQYVGFSRVLWDSTSSQFKMWYGGGSSDWYAKMGYATAPVIGKYDALSAELPSSFGLMQNYPNPFNPKTVISWQLAVGSNVDLSVYNILGQKVATLVSGKQKAGLHQVEWDASEFASGIYYYIIKAGEFRDVKKMILIQ